MSSTERDDLSTRLRRFFDERLIPAGSTLLRRKGAVLETGFDAASPTYYVERESRTMTREQFELGGSASPEELGSALSAFWERRGEPELAALAPELAGLAGDLREVEEETDEVSPFIYVMF